MTFAAVHCVDGDLRASVIRRLGRQTQLNLGLLAMMKEALPPYPGFKSCTLLGLRSQCPPRHT